MGKIKASLLVSTYEMPEHLKLVAAALARQSATDFEIFFCDDGSSEPTRAVIEQFKAQSKIPVTHVWQEHRGFRKCKILNSAVRQAQGEVLIFLDGDCVPHREYVRDHLAEQEAGYYLAGRRVELGTTLSEKLTPERVTQGFFDWPHPELIRSALIKGETEFLNRSFRIPSPLLRRAFKMNRVADLKGCNYSVPKSALVALNGFDEAYEGYGREDTDIEIRLQHFGLKIKSLKGLALQFHVWHPRREFTPQNDQRLEELKKSGRIRCERGLEDLSKLPR